MGNPIFGIAQEAVAFVLSAVGRSAELGAGGDTVADHQQVQTLVTVLLVYGGDQHAFGINAHHLAGGGG